MRIHCDKPLQERWPYCPICGAEVPLEPDAARERDARRLALWPELVAALGTVERISRNDKSSNEATMNTIWLAVFDVLKRAKEVDHAG